ncbi:hypothetical protein ACMHYB_06215 [Sorangium sp. So ce1128]
MHYRQLGDSELRVSELCLGTMTFGEQNTLEEAKAQLGRGVALLRAAGIPVEVGTLAGDVEAFLGKYLIR